MRNKNQIKIKGQLLQSFADFIKNGNDISGWMIDMIEEGIKTLAQINAENAMYCDEEDEALIVEFVQISA